MVTEETWLAKKWLGKIGYFQDFFNPWENRLKQIQLILDKKRITEEEQAARKRGKQLGKRKYSNYENKD